MPVYVRFAKFGKSQQMNAKIGKLMQKKATRSEAERCYRM